MSHPSRVRSTLHLAAALLTLAVAVQLIAGCSDNKKNPASPGGGTPTSTTFVGVFSNGSENGKISITVNSTNLARRFSMAQAGAASITATATLSFVGGGTAMLTGTYDDAADSLNLTGINYTFAGEYDSTNAPPAFIGTYTGPSGMGFFGAIDEAAAGSTVEIYLGTFQSDSTAVSGTFDVARYDTLAGGLVFLDGTMTVLGMEGMVAASGTTRPITLSGVEGGFSVDATGTLDTVGHSVAGTWHSYDTDISKGDDGIWSGTLEP
jgi:hypothetical protein